MINVVIWWPDYWYDDLDCFCVFGFTASQNSILAKLTTAAIALVATSENGQWIRCIQQLLHKCTLYWLGVQLTVSITISSTSIIQLQWTDLFSSCYTSAWCWWIYSCCTCIYMYGFISSCQWVDAFSSYCYIVRTCMGWVYVNNHITCVSSSCIKCVCADTSTSQLAEPLWTEPGLKSRISMHKLIKKNKKKRRQGMNGWTFSQNPRKWWKSHYHLCSAVIALVFGFLSVNVFSSCHTTAWRLVNE